MDFMELPSTETSAGYVLVAVDYFSRFIWVWVARHADAIRVVAGLQDLATKWRRPRRVITDNGSHFKNKLVRDACDQLGVVSTHTPEYAPWVNGLVERQNGLLVTQLRKGCMEKGIPTTRWTAVLADAVRIINQRPILALGYSPSELMFGVCPSANHLELEDMTTQAESPEAISLPFALLESMRDSATMRHLQTRWRKAPKGAPSVGTTFVKGDLVMARKPPQANKLATTWSGLFRISSCQRTGRTAKLESLLGAAVRGRFHFNRLKRFHPAKPWDNTMEGFESAGEEMVKNTANQSRSLFALTQNSSERIETEEEEVFRAIQNLLEEKA
ncbi:FOG: Transposon-encoded proteins with TYA, reverse transcriptase, integrase domains in various combinations [Ceraceosorus bombacis]|uniref:FOG: Transposon-encoded proteins with TYA, reverse transcriptase, integrase domains in various combinations n=1 Tax=Ceraceosorus bombacis TaxID=401625 RepID=A0A0P1BQ88_9BASI|nr:FOG: Transposon-encoded proteins with TYA, reverse transcriptase, integrase domains in various combinations [Ceraceosorus bombacis]